MYKICHTYSGQEHIYNNNNDNKSVKTVRNEGRENVYFYWKIVLFYRATGHLQKTEVGFTMVLSAKIALDFIYTRHCFKRLYSE